MRFDDLDDFDDDDDTKSATTAEVSNMTAYFIAYPGRPLRIVLFDAALITGEGEDAVVQRFDSARAAREHLDLVLARRRRDGYPITSRPLTAEERASVLGPDGEPDALADCVQWDEAQSRMTLTCRGDEFHPRRCLEVVERAGQLGAEWWQVLCDRASPTGLSGAMRAKPLPRLRSFIFDTHFQTVTRQGRNMLGELDGVLTGAPGLERLFATGDLVLRPTSHPRLVELYMLADSMRPATLAALGACSFHALEVLGLRLAGDGEPPPYRALAAALRELDAPALTHVELAGVSDVVGLLTLLTEGAPLTWQTLRIDGTLDDEDALLALLAARAQHFNELTLLALPLDEVSSGAAERARQLVPQLVELDELDERLTPTTYRPE